MTSASNTTSSSLSINQEYPIREPQNAQELVNLVRWHSPYPFDSLGLRSFQVQTTMTQIQDRFGSMSESIMSRSQFLHLSRLGNEFLLILLCVSVDDMGKRIDDLERNIAHIISQTNAELP